MGTATDRHRLLRRQVQVSERHLWLVWAVAFSCTWLLPSFTQVWPSFDQELFAAVCMGGLACALVSRPAPAWALPWPALFIAAIAVVPLAQFALGQIRFFGDAWLCCLYLLAFSTALVLGHRLRDNAHFLPALLVAFGLAATVSVAIELKQWLRVSGLFYWTRDLPPGARPFGNLGQPNNLATLICLGLVAVWWALVSRRIAAAVAALTAAFLLFGLALTQSRTGWLIVCTLAVFATFSRRQTAPTASNRLLLVSLASFFVVCVFSTDRLGSIMDAGSVETLQDRLVVGYRALHWSHMLHALAQKPWWGWGWGQVGVAQQVVAPSLPAVPELISYSHNLVLDLLVWNGIPIGGLVIGMAAAWLFRSLKRLQGPSDHFVFMLLLVVLVHSMLELPFAYLFFLIPAGFCVGLLTRGDQGAPLRVPRGAVAAFCLVGAAAIGWTLSDFIEARDSFTARRYEMARIGPSRHSEPPDLTLLTQLAALARMDRTEIHEHATDAELHLARMTAERFPAQRTLMQYAALSAGRGDLPSARLALVRLCKLNPPEDCRFAAAVWQRWGESRYPWLRLVRFPEAAGL